MTDKDKKKVNDHIIKVFSRLNSHLRHNALSNVNTASLALHMMKFGEENIEGMLDIFENALDKVLEQLLRTYELEEILHCDNWTLETRDFSELIEEVSKQYSDQVKVEFQIDLPNQIEAYYSAIFMCLFRNAVKYRNASEIELIIKLKEKNREIEFNDNGIEIPQDIISSLEGEVEFDSKIHDYSHFDLFIANAILNNYSTKIKKNEKTSKGLIIYN